MSNPPTIPESIDTRLLGAAVEVASDRAGGELSMEALRAQLETAEFKSALLARIEGTPALQAKYPNAEAAVDALRNHLGTVEKTLAHKEAYVQKKESIFRKFGRGIRKVVTHPLVLIPLLAIGGFLIYQHLSGISSRLHEAVGQYARETQERGNRATPSLAPPADRGITGTSGGSTPVVPPGSTEQIDPYFGWSDWLWGNPPVPGGGTPPGGQFPAPPQVPPGGALGVPIPPR